MLLAVFVPWCSAQRAQHGSLGKVFWWWQYAWQVKHFDASAYLFSRSVVLSALSKFILLNMAVFASSSSLRLTKIDERGLEIGIEWVLDHLTIGGSWEVPGFLPLSFDTRFVLGRNVHNFVYPWYKSDHMFPYMKCIQSYSHYKMFTAYTLM